MSSIPVGTVVQVIGRENEYGEIVEAYDSDSQTYGVCFNDDEDNEDACDHVKVHADDIIRRN